MPTKTHCHRDYDFDAYCDERIAAGELVLLDCRRDLPYLGEEADAHFWVSRIPTAAEGV